MTLADIFSSQYLFNPTPPTQNKYMLYQMVVFGAFIAIAIVYLLLKKMDAKIRFRHFYCFLTGGILGYIYIFARYESLPWLGSRIYLVLVMLTLIIWSTINTIWLYRYSAKLEDKKVMEDRYEKYLPKPKK